MTEFEHTALTRLGQFFGPAAAARPGLSGFSLLGQAREAFITRLAAALASNQAATLDAASA